MFKRKLKRVHGVLVRSRRDGYRDLWFWAGVTAGDMVRMGDWFPSPLGVPTKTWTVREFHDQYDGEEIPDRRTYREIDIEL